MGKTICQSLGPCLAVIGDRRVEGALGEVTYNWSCSSLIVDSLPPTEIPLLDEKFRVSEDISSPGGGGCPASL